MKDPVALGFWKRHAPALIESGHLDPVMADAFAIGCKLFSDCQRLEALLAETGEIVQTARGTPMAHPGARMLRDSRRDLAKICSEFGMTPAATARIPKARDTSKEPANPLAKFGIVD
jgi:P27 family predicted phage terminase small subunit